MFLERKQFKKKKKDRTTMEDTDNINSSLEDFVKRIMGRLIHWHKPQRLLKTPIKDKKMKRENFKYIYIVYIYIYIK